MARWWDARVWCVCAAVAAGAHSEPWGCGVAAATADLLLICLLALLLARAERWRSWRWLVRWRWLPGCCWCGGACGQGCSTKGFSLVRSPWFYTLAAAQQQEVSQRGASRSLSHWSCTRYARTCRHVATAQPAQHSCGRNSYSYSSTRTAVHACSQISRRGARRSNVYDTAVPTGLFGQDDG